MERRRHQRRRVLKKASIQFDASTIDCAIRNMSSAGALLDVESPLGIPREFTLVISADALRIPCRIAWAKERRLGVVFQR